VTSGDTLAVTTATRLVTFDRADPALDTAIAITGLQSGETILGIDTRAGGATPGQLYALGSTGRVYTVDTTSGVASPAATLAADSADSTDPFTALSGTEFGIDFDPVSDKLRVVSDTGQNLRVDVASGATITDAPLTTGGNPRSGVNAAAYTNAFGAACRTALYYIDANTDELLTTSDPAGGALASVGALGVDTSAVSDFEIATDASGTNTGYAVLVVGGVPTSYTIDLGSGAATSAGPVTLLDSGEVVRDTAIAPPATAPTQDPGDLFAVTESGRLVSFSSTAPQKVCTTVQLAGQQSGETILSVDVRPATQSLYALGSTGRLYDVDTMTGALTLKGTLVAALGDTDPYTGLEGTEHGIDFNPANDLLRIVGDNGFNVRVLNLDAVGGTTVTTDPDLTPGGTAMSAGAYGNGVLGTAIGTFFMVDSASDALYSLGGLTGTVTVVGTTLGLGDVSSVGGFDIYGTNNRGIAALSVGGDTGSTLYNVQLNTGVATAVGPIGTGERVRSLTYSMAPEATLWGLTNTGRLVSFTMQNPGTFIIDTAVTGLQGGESLVAIDVRPADGQLYGLTSAGRLVPVDPTTGVAGAGLTLTANPADVAAPVYAGLSGTRFGMDFHAFDDLLRIHSNTGQSLRVVTASGSVSQDTDLQAAMGFNPPQVIGTAYNNSYVGGGSTVSWVIDAGNNRVMRHASVGGTMEFIGGATGVDIVTGGIQAEGDMDVAGGENGLVLAALLPVGATQSVLYRIAQATGAGTALSPIGPDGTVLTDFAIQLR
jgi:trimeric autotransporter adhesin